MTRSDAAFAEREANPSASNVRAVARHWATRAVAIFLISRLLPLAGFALAQRRAHIPVSLSTMLQRWDGWWYVYLARNGYPSTLTIPSRPPLPGKPSYGPWGFFPVWPWTIRLGHDITRLDYPLAAGLLVTVYGVGLVIVLRIYAARLVGPAAADVVVLLFCVFPGTLVLCLAYTEASFLFWVVLALLLLDSGRWEWAALATFMACATRSTGAALVAAALTVAVLAIRRRREWRSLLVPLAGPLAFVLAGWFARSRTGDAAIWLRAQKQWGQVLDWGRGLGKFARQIPMGGADRSAAIVMLVMTVVLVALLALGAPLASKLPTAAWIYLAVTVVSIFAYSNVGPRPRMILALLPLLIPAAARLAAWGRRQVVAAVVPLAALTVLFAYMTMYPHFHVVA